MNDLERILYVKNITNAYSSAYLNHEAPPEVISELVEIIKTAINQGLTWTERNPSIPLNRQKPDPSDAASGSLGRWQIVESSAGG
jgi:hypothetical protein